MLSAVELDYLKSPEHFNPNYSKGLRLRLRRKVEALNVELRLLENAGFKVTGNCNAVTEFYNREQSLN